MYTLDIYSWGIKQSSKSFDNLEEAREMYVEFVYKVDYDVAVDVIKDGVSLKQYQIDKELDIGNYVKKRIV